MPEIKASPRNRYIGLLADALQAGKSGLDNVQLPVVGGLGSLLMGDAPEMVNEVAYYGPQALVKGGNAATGGIGTFRPDPRVLDLAGAVAGAPGAGRVAKTAANPLTYRDAFYQAMGPGVMSRALPDGTPFSADDARKVAKKLGLDYDNPPKRGDYVGGHKAPTYFEGEDTASMSDLVNVFGEDIYGPRAAQYFGEGRPDDQTIARIFRTVRDKPLQEVTVYRAVPKSLSNAEINPQDWVTQSLDYAKQHGNYFDEGAKIIKKKVPAGSLVSDGNSMYEFGYDPFGLFKKIVD